MNKKSIKKNIDTNAAYWTTNILSVKNRERAKNGFYSRIFWCVNSKELVHSFAYATVYKTKLWPIGNCSLKCVDLSIIQNYILSIDTLLGIYLFWKSQLLVSLVIISGFYKFGYSNKNADSKLISLKIEPKYCIVFRNSTK